MGGFSWGTDNQNKLVKYKLDIFLVILVGARTSKNLLSFASSLYCWPYPRMLD